MRRELIFNRERLFARVTFAQVRRARRISGGNFVSRKRIILPLCLPNITLGIRLNFSPMEDRARDQ
jgi:hypothetical protein